MEPSPQPASLWEPAPRQAPVPPPSARPLPAKPPWYRRAWFQALWVVVVFGAAGAFLGSQVR